MKLSGPIKADLIKCLKNKRICLLSDCHMVGNGCKNSNTLVDTFKEIFESKKSEQFLLLLESSLDVVSVYTDLDIVKFSRKMLETKFENVKIECTDIRREGEDDNFWLEDYFIHSLDQYANMFQIISKLKKEYDLKQVDLLFESVRYLKENFGLLYDFLEREFEMKLLTFLTSRNDDDMTIVINWIMDSYTIYLILFNKINNVIYYAGELHTRNLIQIFRVLDSSLTKKQFKSKFFSFCETRNCNNPESHDIKKGLSLENSRCLFLDIDLNEFFSIE